MWGGLEGKRERGETGGEEGGEGVLCWGGGSERNESVWEESGGAGKDGYRHETRNRYDARVKET